MRQALTGARVFTGEAIRAGRAVLIERGRIADVVPEAAVPAAAERVALPGGLLAPGFVDLQVNGGGGVLLNDAPTVEGIATIARAHRRFGTTGLLPTLITDTPEVTDRAVTAVRDAIAAGVPGILGIHLEGPHLAPERKGIHDPARIRGLGEGDLERLSALPRTLGRTLVTLAPETVPAGTVRALAEAGVIVAAGHTAATYEQLRAAQDEGLAGFTHLFNAMSQLGAREPGAVGAALDHEASFCGVIADGHHVHPAGLRLAYRIKGAGRLCLVTDAMAVTGSDLASFELHGRRIFRRDGRLTSADGTLAGADLDMATAVRNAVALMGAPLKDALRMASTTPAACLGLGCELGRLAPGYRADLVHLDDALQVRATWIGGVMATAGPGG